MVIGFEAARVRPLPRSTGLGGLTLEPAAGALIVLSWCGSTEAKGAEMTNERSVLSIVSYDA